MKNSGIPLSSLPPALRAQVVAKLGTAEYAKQDRKRLRQSSKGPNKTEAAFGLWLANEYPTASIDYEHVTLRIGNGVKFTPDWFVHWRNQGDKRPQIFETKGFMESDAAVKLKVAARVHSWADFYLVSRKSRTSAGWDIQHILP